MRTHQSTSYTPSYVSVHLPICMYVTVSLCTVSSPKRLRQFSDNHRSSFCLSIWKRGTSGVCTSHQPRILIRKKKFRQVKQLNKKNKQKNPPQNKSVHNSYWQTTPRNIWRISKSLFFLSGSRDCLPDSPFPPHGLKATAKPRGSHSKQNRSSPSSHT